MIVSVISEDFLNTLRNKIACELESLQARDLGNKFIIIDLFELSFFRISTSFNDTVFLIKSSQGVGKKRVFFYHYYFFSIKMIND